MKTHGCGFWMDTDASASTPGAIRILDEEAREMGAHGRGLTHPTYSWPAIARANCYAAGAQGRRYGGRT
jgi:hypothetical protein